MNSNKFEKLLKKHLQEFKKAIATSEGDWIVKGFIDVYKNIYTISIDTKIVSKVIELLLIPELKKFAEINGFSLESPKEQNYYPDATFIELSTGDKFAVDMKTTIRKNETTVNVMTLGAFTGYFRNRNSKKNINYPYDDYKGHFCLGVIYSQTDDSVDESKRYTLAQLEKIKSVIHDFNFFIHPKYKIATDKTGSGNTKNIGGITNIEKLLKGEGPFCELGEEIFDDYWMYYLTEDMARAQEVERPYTNLKTYLEYKKKGIEKLKNNEALIRKYDLESNEEE